MMKSTRTWSVVHCLGSTYKTDKKDGAFEGDEQQERYEAEVQNENLQVTLLKEMEKLR